MTVYRDRRDGAWRYRRLRLQDGTELRISGTPPIDTRVAAESAERAHIMRALAAPQAALASAPATQPAAAPQPQPSPRKEVVTFETFAEEFMATYAKANNKPSEQTAKASILKLHLVPALGRVPLDRIGVQDVERLKAASSKR